MLNKVMLIGHLGADPDIRSSNGGDDIATFSLATSERWKDRDSGEKKERTEWHRIVVFGPLVEVIKSYVKKGSKIFVSGTLRTRKWQDNSGNDRWSTEVVLSGFNAQLLMLDSAGGGAGSRDYSGYQDGPGSGGGSGGGRSGNDGWSDPGRSGRGSSAFDSDLDDDVPF